MAASTNVTELEFNAVASAAVTAYYRGEYENAKALDKLARKINVALTNNKYRGMHSFSDKNSKLTWQQVDGPLKTMGLFVP